jgi:hypothetical protein
VLSIPSLRSSIAWWARVQHMVPCV